MKYATLDDSLRKINLDGKGYEVEVHCLCDNSDNIRYLAILKGKHRKIDSNVLKEFIEKNLDNHKLYACSFYQQFDLDHLVSAYVNRRTKKKRPKKVRNLFQKADQGARKYSKVIKLKLKSLRDIRREGNLGHVNGIELLLMDV